MNQTTTHTPICTHYQHTPTPWERYAGIIVQGPSQKTPNGSKRLTICRCDNMSMGEVEQGANADFIVRACNAHDDLLAACEDVVGLIELYAAGDQPLQGRRLNADRSETVMDGNTAVHDVLEQLRAAIAKAKQEATPQ